jgi:uncharacterized protein (DUF2147 family)
VTRAAAALAFALALGAAASGPDPRGEWWVEGGAARVVIEDCESGLCGRVVWLRSPFGIDGCALRDVENPDEALRARPVMGLAILEGLRPDPDRSDVWREGRIYDPGSGRTYAVVVRAAEVNRLDVRGYVAFELLGRTTTWFRVGREGGCADG